jgi:hypothetical protein
MSEINDQLSDTSSDLNWPLEHHIEGQQHDRVVFENVADQYPKGENVTAFFTILQDIKTDPDADRIGLLRVGSTNFNECLTYAPVQFAPSITSGSVRHGTATFPSASLPVTDDEFYQFCYILNGTKNIGSSIPFQLNCAIDDIDLLSNKPVGKTTSDGFIALADHDNDDLVVIHTKRMLTEEKLRQENRQLLEMNRRLELQKDECQAKVDLLEYKLKEQITKFNHDIQALIASNKTALDELSSRQQSEIKLRSDYDACRALCNKYQSEVSEFVDRCRILEEAQASSLADTNQARSQLAVTTQLAKEQATQVIDLERRLMQANEVYKTSTQRQTLLEQQLRDSRLASEKNQLNMQTQIEDYIKQTVQSQDQIHALETTNNLLKDELNTVKNDNEYLLTITKQEKDANDELKQKLQQLDEQYQEKNDLAQNEIETLRNELKEKNIDQKAYMTLKTSFTEVEKRCVKHQKSEVEVKRQLAGYQSFINDLQREIHELTERLSAGAEEYKTLFRKYTLLQQSVEINEKQETTVDTTNEPVYKEDELFAILHNSYEGKQQQQEQEQEPEPVPEPEPELELELEPQVQSNRSSLAEIDQEVQTCPMCSWTFPVHMSLDGKREHIENHFQ